MLSDTNTTENQLLVEAVERSFDYYKLDAPPKAAQQLVSYVGLIQKWNRTYNLTAIKTPREILTHHIFDSLSVLNATDAFFAEREFITPKVLDVGSGAGLPGIVMAIVRPNYVVTCVDAVEKKVSFIRAVATGLVLSNLSAMHARIESLSPNHANLVISRAFASLDDFFYFASQHVGVNGALVAMKARQVEAELKALGPEKTTGFVTSIQKLTVPDFAASRCLVWLKKEQ